MEVEIRVRVPGGTKIPLEQTKLKEGIDLDDYAFRTGISSSLILFLMTRRVGRGRGVVVF